LRDGSTRQLDARDSSREAEVILDPAGGSSLATESGALDDQRVEPFGGAVHGGGESRGAAADHEQVDLLPSLELPAHSERPEDVAVGRVLQLSAAGQAHQRRLLAAGRRRLLPRVGQAVCPNEFEQPHRGLGRTRPHDLEADSLDPLQGFAPGDEGREQDVAELTVLEQQPAQDVPVDRDVAQGLLHERGQERRLPREQVQLTQEFPRAAADDLVARSVEDRDLTLQDRDKRIVRVADSEERVADARRTLLTHFAEPLQLGGGQ
jgi:hypothetical protein